MNTKNVDLAESLKLMLPLARSLIEASGTEEGDVETAYSFSESCARANDMADDGVALAEYVIKLAEGAGVSVGKHTAASVRAEVESRIEDDTFPDAVLAVFRGESGKPLTKRIFAKLPSSGQGTWRFEQVAGMTSLVIEDYHARTQTEGQREAGYSFLVARAEKNIAIDPKFLEEENVRYFAARRERNAARREVMGSGERCEAMSKALNDADEAVAQFFRAREQLHALTTEAFGSDRQYWQVLAGLHKVRS